MESALGPCLALLEALLERRFDLLISHSQIRLRAKPYVELPLKAAPNTVVYEVCQGEEVYYVFTLLPTPCTGSVLPREDGWGATKDAPLHTGRF